MKRVLIALCAFTISTAAMSQATNVNSTTQVAKQKKATELVKFTVDKHNFGKIKEGVPVTFDFAFQNVGNQPVVIESATASCGCTTPTWPKEPVSKNNTSKISAGFNAANPGPFDKTITVKVAGYDQPVELKITGEVLSAENYAKYEAGKPKKSSK